MKANRRGISYSPLSVDEPDKDNRGANKNAGTESMLSGATNIAKAIVGAGSFALPHVFREEGVIGGTLALVACGALASYTIESLAQSRQEVGSPSSYVELARITLGEKSAKLVFSLTLCASLGVCSSYLVFLGQTLEGLSVDTESNNVVAKLFPETRRIVWEIFLALALVPLALVRDSSIFSFTSALGVIAVCGGLLVTLISGIFVDPGRGIASSLGAVTSQRMWPESFERAFGSSFGTVAFLFCVNFLTFPIMNSMKFPQRDFRMAVRIAICGTGSANIIFAALCYGFFGEETSDLILDNLGNGPYLSALKLLLCIDLFFTFPIVFNSGRQIMEHAILGTAGEEDTFRQRFMISAFGIFTCLTFAQIGCFGAVANLVGGVAQGTLAFMVPPAIRLSLKGDSMTKLETVLQCTLFVFGAVTVSSTSWYSALVLLGWS